MFLKTMRESEAHGTAHLLDEVNEAFGLEAVQKVRHAISDARAAGVPWLKILATVLPLLWTFFAGGGVDLQAIIDAILALFKTKAEDGDKHHKKHGPAPAAAGAIALIALLALSAPAPAGEFNCCDDSAVKVAKLCACVVGEKCNCNELCACAARQAAQPAQPGVFGVAAKQVADLSAAAILGRRRQGGNCAEGSCGPPGRSAASDDDDGIGSRGRGIARRLLGKIFHRRGGRGCG